MLLIRGFEDRVQSLFLRGEVYGTTHLYSGQEAVAVGFASVLREGDRIACTYRGHGHLLAMGSEPEALLAELLGRETGAERRPLRLDEHGRPGARRARLLRDRRRLDRGGDRRRALAARHRARSPSRTSATARSTRPTSTSASTSRSVFRLPLVLVCENNGYGEYTPYEAVTPGGIIPRAAALDVQTMQIDGMDIRAVRAAAAEVVERVRGGGPVFVEALTYRFVGHSRSDPGKYRPEGELDRWRERDPLAVAAAELRHRGRRAGADRGRRDRRARADRGGRARRAVPGRALDPGVQRRMSAETVVAIRMPKLSDSMEEATVLAWLKRPGDTVKRGEPLVEVETDKATIVYEAEADGVLDEILVDDGQTAALGAPIAHLRTSDAAPQHAKNARPGIRASDRRRPSRRPPGRARRRTARARATPVARRLAQERGVSLDDVAGSGPGGRIVARGRARRRR